MINTFFRKTLYKYYDFQTQTLLLHLLGPIHFFYLLSNILILIVILLPIFLLPALFPLLFSHWQKQLFYLILVFLYTLVTIFVFRKNGFFDENCLSKFLHFYLFTQKGNAISKKDFKVIRQNDKLLYHVLKHQTCRGKCYATSFQLLKTLKNGLILFISIPEITLKDETPYNTMHVLFVNQNWVFDTYSQRQFPLKKILSIYMPKIYKAFSFDDVKNYSYEEFRDAHYEDLAKWCKKNDTFQFWNCD